MTNHYLLFFVCLSTWSTLIFFLVLSFFVFLHLHTPPYFNKKMSANSLLIWINKVKPFHYHTHLALHLISLTDILLNENVKRENDSSDWPFTTHSFSSAEAAWIFMEMSWILWADLCICGRHDLWSMFFIIATYRFQSRQIPF